MALPWSSWVGTGWTLNAGGVINRQQRGIIDEQMIENFRANQQYVVQIYNAVNSSLGLSDQDAPKYFSLMMRRCSCLEPKSTEVLK